MFVPLEVHLPRHVRNVKYKECIFVDKLIILTFSVAFWGSPGPVTCKRLSIPRRDLIWCWCVVALLSAVVTIYITGVPLSRSSLSLSHKPQHHDNPEPYIVDPPHIGKLRNVLLTIIRIHDEVTSHYRQQGGHERDPSSQPRPGEDAESPQAQGGLQTSPPQQRRLPRPHPAPAHALLLSPQQLRAPTGTGNK